MPLIDVTYGGSVDQEVPGCGDRQPHRMVRRGGLTRRFPSAQAQKRRQQDEQLPHQSTSCSSITP